MPYEVAKDCITVFLDAKDEDNADEFVHPNVENSIMFSPVHPLGTALSNLVLLLTI